MLQFSVRGETDFTVDFVVVFACFWFFLLLFCVWLDSYYSPTSIIFFHVLFDVQSDPLELERLLETARRSQFEGDTRSHVTILKGADLIHQLVIYPVVEGVNLEVGILYFRYTP